MTESYTNAVAFIIKRFLIALVLFAGMIGLSVMMMDSIPKAFLPEEDQGYLLGAVIMPDAASLDRTECSRCSCYGLFYETRCCSRHCDGEWF